MGFGDRFKGLADMGRRMQEQAVALQEQAVAMQEQAMAMHQHQQQTADAEGEAPAWDPTAFMLPPSEFVKRGTCDSCGAPKQLPTIRQYLYCDFCGELMDYDLRRAAEAGATSPTITTYAEIANQIGPEADRVRRAGDRERFQDLQRQLYSAQADYTPWAVPPRAWNNKGYRDRWIDYSTAVAVTAAFDPTQADHAERVKSLALRLQWKGGMGLGMLGGMVATVRRIGTHGLDPQQMTPKAEMSSFWPLAEAMMAQTQHLQELIRHEGISELDPDGGRPATSDRLTRSMLAQGWVPRLEPDDGEQFLDWLGLRHEYQRPEVTGETRHCVGCGHDVTALDGATRIVCDACGRVVDLAAPQIVCSGCNTRVAFNEGETHVQCPYCQAEIRRI